jgi:hypothetical protein
MQIYIHFPYQTKTKRGKALVRVDFSQLEGDFNDPSYPHAPAHFIRVVEGDLTQDHLPSEPVWYDIRIYLEEFNNCTKRHGWVIDWWKYPFYIKEYQPGPFWTKQEALEWVQGSVKDPLSPDDHEARIALELVEFLNTWPTTKGKESTND